MARRPRDRSQWGANIETPYMAKLRVERERTAFVRQWRAANPVEVWGKPWHCPLCNKAVQDFYDLPPHNAQIEDHQQSHGSDWTAYAAIDAAAPSGG